MGVGGRRGTGERRGRAGQFCAVRKVDVTLSTHCVCAVSRAMGGGRREEEGKPLRVETSRPHPRGLVWRMSDFPEPGPGPRLLSEISELCCIVGCLPYVPLVRATGVASAHLSRTLVCNAVKGRRGHAHLFERDVASEKTGRNDEKRRDKRDTRTPPRHRRRLERALPSSSPLRARPTPATATRPGRRA